MRKNVFFNIRFFFLLLFSLWSPKFMFTLSIFSHGMCSRFLLESVSDTCFYSYHSWLGQSIFLNIPTLSMTTKYSYVLHSLVLPIPTAMVRIRYPKISCQLNHPHIFCILKVKKFQTDIFLSRTATIRIDAHLDDSLNTAILTI